MTRRQRHVCFTQKADIAERDEHVRFVPEADITPHVVCSFGTSS